MKVIKVCLLLVSIVPLVLHGQVVTIIPQDNPNTPPQEVNPEVIPPADNVSNNVLPKVSAVPERAMDVLDYWFGQLPSPDYFPDDQMDIWFAATPEIDREMRQEFSEDVEKAARGEYNYWRATPRGRLALLLLLDQFPRHIYRNRPQAFMTDAMARGIVLEGLQKGDDRTLLPVERAFFYLPLEHAESPEMQRLSVDSYYQLLADVPMVLKPVMQEFLRYAILHQQQIDRFGRFPHRNAILGRPSTPEEIIFLRLWSGGAY